MTIINIFEKTGPFAENKDIAKEFRLNFIIPSIQRSEKVILNFDNVKVATQSFIHALISDVIQQKGRSVLNHIEFKSCNESIKAIIQIVASYVQESLDD